MNLPKLSVRHLLGIRELSSRDILTTLHVAGTMRQNYLDSGVRGTLLQGKTVVNLFIEDSTRTRNSFQLAETRLGATSLNVTGGGSSLSKGETLLDTARVIEAMNVDAIVLRHSAATAPHFLAERCSSIFINAGDGRHEHPTQGLLDAFTLFERWYNPAQPEKTGFEGKRVTIVGDISHGRVAGSNIPTLQKLGADVAVCGPPTLIPRGIEELGVRVIPTLDEAIESSDALNMLRMQLERQKQAFVPSIAEYSRLYGLNHNRLRQAERSDLLILHPGPINRGVELDSETADSSSSLILRQVGNGVAVRMAILALLLNPEVIESEENILSRDMIRERSEY
ncbi:MAG: aspartate carbamoyltransferase catalytic subunit [Candidatus Kapaibacterium sp.]